MDKFKKVKVIGNVIGFNRYAFGEKETYNVQFPDMTVAELESYQFEDADAYHTNGKPLCLRNVLARLRELPEHDREVWLKGIMDEFELDFSHAKWREGYDVEQEKLYTVEIPSPNADGYSIALGRKEGKVYIRQFISPTWQMSHSNQLTEAEIKQDFDWAWQWAKPAEVQEAE